MRVAGLVWALAVSATAQTLSPVVPAEIQTQLDAHNYPKAEQAIHEKLAASPGWDAGHVLLAQIYNATGRYALAEAERLDRLAGQSLEGATRESRDLQNSGARLCAGRHVAGIRAGLPASR